MSPPSRSNRERLAGLAKIVFALLGVGAVALLVRQIGLRELGALITRALPWIPPLLLLEGMRLGAETYGTRAMCGRDGERIDLGTWIRMHLVANAALAMLPAGRAMCEGIKIAAMSKELGAPRAAGYVVVQHSMNLLALALISVPCAGAAYLITGPSLLTLAIVIHLALCAIGAVLVQVAARRAVVPKFAAKWFVHSEGALTTFRDTARALPWVEPRALLGKFGSRLLQVAQFVIILHAIGTLATVDRGFLANGVNLVGQALGELTPAQIGATDGSFAFAAAALGTTIAIAVTMANLARFVQMSWSAVGALVPVISRGGRNSIPSSI